MKTLIKRVVPAKARLLTRALLRHSSEKIERIIDNTLIKKINERSTYKSLVPALYDTDLDVLKFPHSADEFMMDINRGELADARSWLLKADPFVPRGGIIFDVGAYRGVTAQWFAKRSKLVYAFEPMPENVECIRQVINVRKIDNIVIIQSAVSDAAGIQDLFIYDIKGHNSLGRVRTSRYVGKIEVQVTTLDEFHQLQNLNEIDFLKIDVEGFELEVLSGARKLIESRAIRCLMFEVSQEPLRDLGKSASPIYDFLTSHGYFVHDFEGREVDCHTVVNCQFGDFLARPKP